MRQDALACVEAAIAAVEPERLVAAALRDLEERDDPGSRPVWIVAIGKAAAAMARAATRALGARVRDGVVVVPPGVEADRGLLSVVCGGHPVPDEGSVRAGRAVREMAGRVPGDGLLLTLVSGGGSALVTLPPSGLSLADVRAATDLLLAPESPSSTRCASIWTTSRAVDWRRPPGVG